MNQHLQTILDFIQQAEHLSAEEKAALLKAAKNADKELEITSFKLERTEKVKHTTAILLEETIEELEQKRKAVEAQNRELEIESALERVRSVALAMKGPDDMLDVCKVIATELNKLDVKEIRNVQTAIFYETKGVYINYEFYAKHDKTLITEVDYSTHTVQSAFAEQMMKGANEFFTQGFTGKQVQDWYAYQKTTNVFLDSYLEHASSLNYYWYSLGPVALGMSTYLPLSEEQIILFQRFRNVFGLAYRRYLDIEQALAQAKEARIETALERVRAVAMAMRKPGELTLISEIIFTELKSLDFSDLRNAEIIINNDSKETIISYYSDYGISGVIEIDYKTNLIVQGWANDLRKANDAFVEIVIPENEMDAWRKYREEIGYLPDPKLNEAKTVYYYSYSIGLGALSISSFRPITKEQIKILERFRNVFKLSYQRYIDIEHAEVQAREAQIELALERVRARTMAMHVSDELADVVHTLYEELQKLNFRFGAATVVIMNSETGDMEHWVAGFSQEKYPERYLIKYFDHPCHNTQLSAWKRNEKTLVYPMIGEERVSYTDYIFEHTAYKNFPESEKEWMRYTDPIFTMAYMKHGALMWAPNPATGEQLEILQRFAKVFEQTYTRFLDLQKAEAQSRESQIQLALERARTQSMIMQHSNELDDTLRVFHEQVLLLGIKSAFSFLWLPDEDKDQHIFWAAWAENNSTVFKSKAINYPLDRNEPATAQCLIDWKSNEPVVAYHVAPASVKDYFAAWSELITGVDELKPENFSDGLYYVEAFMKYGCFGVMVKNTLPEDEKKILSRFAVEFERAYTRFLDLQKAEAQAKEGQVQLALERVRARTMAMQHSNELPDAANILFQQIQTLGMPAWSAGYCIWDDDKQAITLWMSSAGIIQKPFRAPVTEDPSFIHFYDAWKRGETFYVEEIGGNAIISHYQYMLQLPVVGEMLKQFIAEGGSLPTFQIYHLAFFSQGFLLFITYEPVPEAHDIFKRFAKVFEQTYTRFLDLQKAEAQSRESQIEAALERVRSRSMGMQKSEELKEVIKIVYKQFVHLNINIDHTGFVVDYKPKGDWHFWIADEQKIPSKITHPYFDSVWANQFNEAKEKGIDFFATNLNFEEKNKFYRELLSYVSGLPEESKNFYLSAPGVAASTVLFENVSLYIENFSGIPYTDEENVILMRFGKVFQQTYTRFLDLQKAETQAREAQIQLALERVRARTMAMQHSDELKDAAALLFQQAKSLGVPAYSCGYNIWEKDEKEFTSWMSTQDGSIINGVPNIRLTEDANFIRYVESKENDEPFFVLELRGERMQEHYQYLKTIPAFKGYFDYAVSVGFDLPETQIHHLANFSHGNLLFITLEPCPEFHDVFKRFATVFEQTYTRFLDLKKAEAQAREAKIEAAMEKVRSRAMAMQKPDELVEVAQLLRKEMNSLGIEELETSSIYIHHEDTQKTECWYAIKDVEHPEKELVSDHMTIDLNETSVGKKMFQFYRSGQKQVSILMQGDARKEWINYCADHSKVLVGFYGDNIPDRTYHLYKFSNGYMGAASPGDISKESWDLLQRATSVFSLAYTRFSDLQQAEAQAREANIETALERVRSRTLAMQRSEELAETAAVLFKQLILLGIEPNRLYINIIRDETGEGEFWITDEDGSKVSSAFAANMNNNDSLKKMYEGWKEKKKSLIIDMQGNELQQYFDHLTSLNVPFKDGLTQKRRIQHIAYFSKGFIGMASPDEQPEGTTFLLERFAGVFNLTFTRFNDLKIAEAHAIKAEQDLIALMAAKKKAEDALTELKATQSQLIQSEKMASLGELTAGIAHEIQNPLNFVNNFSEVSNELVDEMNDELDKGDINEAKIIAGDIKQNLEKINHHGKRADAIVKGMLQHSRTSSGQKEFTDINALVDEYLRLSYHGLRAKDKDFNATMQTDFDETIGNINIIPQDIGRVLLNLYNNAFYATNEKQKAESLKQNAAYKPLVTVSTKKINSPSGDGDIEVKVKDNGNGIPQKVVDKIFQPFFTTKPTGQGTGLGLSLSYDIVKAHGGEIKVESREGEGSEFMIQLPTI